MPQTRDSAACQLRMAAQPVGLDHPFRSQPTTTSADRHCSIMACARSDLCGNRKLSASHQLHHAIRRSRPAHYRIYRWRIYPQVSVDPQSGKSYKSIALSPITIPTWWRLPCVGRQCSAGGVLIHCHAGKDRIGTISAPCCVWQRCLTN